MSEEIGTQIIRIVGELQDEQHDLEKQRVTKANQIARHHRLLKRATAEHSLISQKIYDIVVQIGHKY